MTETTTEEPKKEEPKNEVYEAAFPPKHPPRSFIVTEGVFQVVKGVGIFKGPVKHDFTKGMQVSLSDLDITESEVEENVAYYVQDIEKESFRISKDSEGKELIYIKEGEGIVAQKTGKIRAPLKTCIQMLSYKRWTPLQKPPKVKEKDSEGNEIEVDDPSFKPKRYSHWHMGIDIEPGQNPYVDSEPYHPIIHPFQSIWISMPKGIKKSDPEPEKDPPKPDPVIPNTNHIDTSE